VGLVLVGLKITFNGYSWGWADRDFRMGLVGVWVRFLPILRFRTSVILYLQS
jgi:hypothetical protein